MIKSDHPGRCELAGTVGASGNFSSFYTETPSWEFDNLEYEGRVFRNSERMLAMINEMIESNDPEVIQATQETSGFTAKKSAFWKLRIFARHFFERFGVCSLHLISLGLIKLCADLICDLAGAYKDDISPAQYRKKMSKAIDELCTPSYLTKISYDIYKEAKKEGSKFTGPLSGKMWRTYGHLSIIAHREYVTPLISECILTSTSLLKPNKYKLWSKIMNGLLAILQRQWTFAEIQQGGAMDVLVKAIKSNMIDLFPNKTFKNPNFETLHAVPSQIRFLGPLWYQSTSSEEGTNKDKRKAVHYSNFKNTCNDILLQNENMRAARMKTYVDDKGNVKSAAEFFSQRKSRDAKEEFELYKELKNNVKPTTDDKKKLSQVYIDPQVTSFGIRNIVTYRGFYYEGAKVVVGPTTGLKIKYQDTEYEGELTRVFLTTIRNYGPGRQRLNQKPFAFFGLKLLRFDKDKDRVVRKGKSGQSLIFPLGWGECTIIKTLTLFKDNNNIFVI